MITILREKPNYIQNFVFAHLFLAIYVDAKEKKCDKYIFKGGVQP
ncbi:hypothetical protein GCM10023260_04580 [Bartonella acomydis]|uniref:Uncharacterized protein n=1 Tax=Bartonella acomydis TaxID=686234 RepID=A0ABP9MFP4_9HYPH